MEPDRPDAPRADVPADRRVDRRDVLRKAAVAGAVGWTAPMLISSVASAAVFTPKCAPGAITATSSFVRVQGSCTNTKSEIDATITFAGTCPCRPTAIWCAQKNLQPPVVASTTNSLTFRVVVPANSLIAVTGRVALGCTDRDGDVQFARYDWTFNATDAGSSCNNYTNTVTPPVLSGRTLFTQATCPSLAAPANSSDHVPAPPMVPRQG